MGGLSEWLLPVALFHWEQESGKLLGSIDGSRQIEFSRRQRLEFYLPTLSALSVHLINNLVIGFLKKFPRPINF